MIVKDWKKPPLVVRMAPMQFILGQLSEKGTPNGSSLTLLIRHASWGEISKGFMSKAACLNDWWPTSPWKRCAFFNLSSAMGNGGQRFTKSGLFRLYSGHYALTNKIVTYATIAKCKLHQKCYELSKKILKIALQKIYGKACHSNG